MNNALNINELIEKYNADKSHYRSSGYNETQLRLDFLDPFFSLLGWDIANKGNKSTNEREVLVEEGVRDFKSFAIKKPDYTFRLFSERKFFLEAKKPSIDISKDAESARQVRRYGFTAKIKISVLSNFEYLAIYDTSGLVTEDDNAAEYRISLYHYEEFAAKFDEINQQLGRNSVYNGSFDKEWSHIEEKIKKFSVDDLFLKQINGWRLRFAAQLLKIDNTISEQKLNDLTQSYINSLFFVRICEDRDLETYQTLFYCAQKKDVNLLIKTLKNVDYKYSLGMSNLEYIDILFTETNAFVWSIIEELYYPRNTYSFAVFTSDILGNIYEIFLSEKVIIENGTVSIRPKSETIDRDIVTTPTFIVKDILRKTLIKFCRNKTDKDIFIAKFADIACGSGAFLLEAFEVLQNILIDYYLIHDQEKLQPLSENTFKLKFDVKRQLLLSCLFGVDKDYNAVKACQFGLLLKLLEGETDGTISIPVLPILDHNIFFGNSLITYTQCPEQFVYDINPFDFKDIKFDVIFGNPPYLSTEDIKRTIPNELSLYKKFYKTAFKQFDKYFLFIEKAFEVLNENGYLGYILPSKFMKTGAGEKLRQYLASHHYISEIVSFGAQQIFKNKTTYTCLLIARKKRMSTFSFIEVQSLIEWKIRANSHAKNSVINSTCLNSDVWILEPSTQDILKKMTLKTIPLGDLLGKKTIENGIQTSANNEYIHDIVQDDGQFLYFNYSGTRYRVEKELTRPYYRTKLGSDSAFHTYRVFKPNSFVIYPYKMINNKIVPVLHDDLQQNYPLLFYYLNQIKDKLNNARRDIKPQPQSSDEWYRYGRSQSLENCDVDQKIIVGILSNGYKYAVDNHRTFISSGGTAGYCLINVPAVTQYSVYYIQALLSSKYLEWFASLFGEVFRGGFIARGTKVLKRMPMVSIDFSNPQSVMQHDDIVRLQKALIHDFTLLDTASEREKYIIQRRFDHNKTILDKLLENLFDLGDDDKKIECYPCNVGSPI